MGPRSIDRGIVHLTEGCVSFSVLQWGRDQLIAEFENPMVDVMRDEMLQWGRDQLIAELR